MCEQTFALLVFMLAEYEDPAGVVLTGSNTQGTMDLESEAWAFLRLSFSIGEWELGISCPAPVCGPGGRGRW